LFRRHGCEHTFVTHPTYLREKARTLRIERSLTIDEIAERLALPRTTIFYWVRDLPIARRPPVIASRAQALGNRAMQAKYRLARKAAYAEGRATFASLATDPTFRLRHPAPRPPARLDGLLARDLVLDSSLRGVAQPG
jgi:hypothetical protein